MCHLSHVIPSLVPETISSTAQSVRHVFKRKSFVLLIIINTANTLKCTILVNETHRQRLRGEKILASREDQSLIGEIDLKLIMPESVLDSKNVQ